MLQTIIKQKLESEIDELKNMVHKKGVNTILMEYPDLQYIIKNLENIEKEISLWKELT